MKKIYISILIMSLFCFVGCSSNKNTENESNSKNTTNASNTNNINSGTKNNLDMAENNIGNGIGNAIDSAGNMAGNIISDAGSAIDDVGSGINNVVNGTNSSNTKLINNSQSNNASNSNSQTSSVNTSSNLSQQATKIAQDINSIEGVDKATVIITGETALIGLNLSNNLNDEQVINIKKQAENKAKSSDNKIKNAAVTASPDVVQRISNLANDIKSGKPISGLADELGSLIRRVTPTI